MSVFSDYNQHHFSHQAISRLVEVSYYFDLFCVSLAWMWLSIGDVSKEIIKFKLDEIN